MPSDATRQLQIDPTTTGRAGDPALLRALVAARTLADGLAEAARALDATVASLDAGQAPGEILPALRAHLGTLSETCVCLGQPLLQGGELQALRDELPWRLPDLPGLVFGDLGLGAGDVQNDPARARKALGGVRSYVARHAETSAAHLEGLGYRVSRWMADPSSGASTHEPAASALDLGGRSVTHALGGTPGRLRRVA